MVLPWSDSGSRLLTTTIAQEFQIVQCPVGQTRGQRVRAAGVIQEARGGSDDPEPLCPVSGRAGGEARRAERAKPGRALGPLQDSGFKPLLEASEQGRRRLAPWGEWTAPQLGPFREQGQEPSRWQPRVRWKEVGSPETAASGGHRKWRHLQMLLPWESRKAAVQGDSWV
ncbi:hypothetical protein H1C71_009001 [Ictidomys tridecemlineatus]|nr:hypothetical protein H1C71_009001 [Ictidomys tridecemlineatus]KAG3285427.1 hypothetical protein H1C71_009001 [Ictidomys tridecemlineatus]KAG3285428.1 hypothetical protein H1C71_009001 [Ictidomys tridecemlineatus]KAG3285429.1 hypothetical protein H1C71_009001 [Ictidomys tridecemlineatus]KAG3285430.1 hypothetical protein H1C71_009001 [Ictidomys tridecemlineatus]